MLCVPWCDWKTLCGVAQKKLCLTTTAKFFVLKKGCKKLIYPEFLWIADMFSWNSSPSSIVVKQNTIMVFYCEASQMFYGLRNPSHRPRFLNFGCHFQSAFKRNLVTMAACFLLQHNLLAGAHFHPLIKYNMMSLCWHFLPATFPNCLCKEKKKRLGLCVVGLSRPQRVR